MPADPPAADTGVLGDRPPDVTVVVITFRGHSFIEECLRSLEAQTLPHRVLVIDNASTDGTRELLARAFPGVPVRRMAGNVGFAGGLDAALALVDTRWCAFLNDDAVAEPGWLSALWEVRTGNGVAAVTSRMLLATTDPGPVIINNLGVGLTSDGHGYDLGLGLPVDSAFDRPTEVFGFSGGAALLDASVVRQVGGSPAEFFLYYEDTDISWRLRLAGFRVLSQPTAVVRHRHSATVGHGSELFHTYNERNRLLTLIRCAPGGFAVRQAARFVLTTVSLTVKWLLRRPLPAELNLRPAMRWKIIGRTALATPNALVARRAISARGTVPRDVVARRWLGADPAAVG